MALVFFFFREKKRVLQFIDKVFKKKNYCAEFGSTVIFLQYDKYKKL